MNALSLSLDEIISTQRSTKGGGTGLRKRGRSRARGIVGKSGRFSAGRRLGGGRFSFSTVSIVYFPIF